MNLRRSAGAARAGLFACLVLSGGASFAEEPRTEASAVLEPGVIGVEELASFSITVSSSGFGGLEVHPAFELDNLEIAGGPYQSQSQRWVNGSTSSTLQLTWRLRPKAVGAAKVRAIALTVSGKAFRLSDKEIAVQQEAPPREESAAPMPPRTFDPFEDLFGRPGLGRRPAGQAPARRPKIFLRSELTPATVYAGQQTTYTLWLYTQTDVGAFQPTHMPAFKGFWVKEIPQPSELKPEWLEEKGERFGRVAMLRRALFPLQAGKFTVEPTEVDLVARIADIGPFGTPFGRSETLHLKTDEMTLEVLPLPSPPESFSGAVGDLTVSARLDREALSVGDASTLTVRVTGHGNLQSLRAPRLEVPEGLKLFPPRQESTERLTDGSLVSSQEWSYVLVPQRPGNFHLPAVTLSYFDPASKSYREAPTRPLEMNVSGEASTAAASPASPAPGASIAATPRPSEEAGEETPEAAAPQTESLRPLFISSVLGAGILGAGALLWRRRQRGSASSRLLAHHLRGLRHVDNGAAPRETAAAIEEALRRHLEAQYSIAPGTPVSQWQPRLVAAGVSADVAGELSELTKELHYLRYAPELAAADELRAEALTRAERLARALR